MAGGAVKGQGGGSAGAGQRLHEAVHRESDDPGVRGLRNALATLRRARGELPGRG